MKNFFTMTLLAVFGISMLTGCASSCCRKKKKQHCPSHYEKREMKEKGWSK